MAESNPQLTEALESLEKRLETPIVPGELASWIDDACEAVASLEKHLKTQIDETHPRQYKQILQQDQALAVRVEQMQEQDTELLNELMEVRRLADTLQKSEDRIEPDEAVAEDASQLLIDRGLHLVIAARKQEAAVATWYIESLERDRGDVD